MLTSKAITTKASKALIKDCRRIIVVRNRYYHDVEALCTLQAAAIQNTIYVVLYTILISHNTMHIANSMNSLE